MPVMIILALLQRFLTFTDFNMPVVSTDLENFEQAVLLASHTKPILLDLWADWCSPCLVLAPLLEKIAAEYGTQIGVVKLEVDAGDNMKIAGRYQVRGFPTVMLFRNGVEISRFSGAKPLHFIREFIDQHSDAA